VIGHQALELFVRVLTALVAVMQQTIRSASSPDRHDEGGGHELGRHLRFCSPTNNTFGEQVHYGKNIEPSFNGPDVGEVAPRFWFGADDSKALSSRLSDTADRSPASSATHVAAIERATRSGA